MIRRIGKNLGLSVDDVPDESRQLQTDGYTMLRGVLSAAEVDALGAQILSLIHI